MDHSEYFKQFEQEIIWKGFLKNNFGKRKPEIVPLRAGKLHKTEFGEFIGSTFTCPTLLAVNYYGLFKISTGIIGAMEKVSKVFPDIRSIMAPGVYFNSIRFEHVQDPYTPLADDFMEFKRYIVELRWKRKSG